MFGVCGDPLHPVTAMSTRSHKRFLTERVSKLVSGITLTITEPERKSMLQLTRASPASRASFCYHAFASPSPDVPVYISRTAKLEHINRLSLTAIGFSFLNSSTKAPFPQGTNHFRYAPSACSTQDEPNSRPQPVSSLNTIFADLNLPGRVRHKPEGNSAHWKEQ